MANELYYIERALFYNYRLHVHTHSAYTLILSHVKSINKHIHYLIVGSALYYSGKHYIIIGNALYCIISLAYTLDFLYKPFFLYALYTQ